MLKKVAILANGGDVSGFNAVIRAIVKTAENHNVSAIRLILFYTYFLSSVCSSPMNVFDSNLHAI